MIAEGFANFWIWAGFCIFLVIALSIDGVVMHNPKYSPHRSFKTALVWSLVWIISALLFNFLLWWYLLDTTTTKIANEKALAFLTGYVIEKSLSVDNLFLFYMIFHQLHIPHQFQQRVFSYGIWGAVIFRLLLILIGTWLIMHFHWILYVMGTFLVLTGIKMMVSKQEEKDLSASKLYIFLRRHFRITHEFQNNNFFIRKNTLLYATPLFLALIFIEFSDIVFALDSIPAIFAITTDPFIVWTSNIFAILGLRALYFLLAGAIKKFYLLKYAIALILVFVGAKMLLEPWLEIPVLFSLSIVALILLIFTLLSVSNKSK